MTPFLIIAAAELFCFGVFAPSLGFYHDDWANLERLANAGGLWGGIKYYAPLVLERPLESLQYPLLFALGGLHPLPYQLFYVGGEIVEGWLLYLLLDRITGRRELALLASVMILVFPTHAVTHFWLGSAATIITVDLSLASLLLHLRWLESRRARDLAWGQLLYLLGLLNYEAAAFLPLMLAGGILGREVPAKNNPLQAAKNCLRDNWPFAATLAAALLWQRGIVHFIRKGGNPRGVSPSASHIVKAYQAGFECATNRVVDVCARMGPIAWRGLGWSATIAALAACAACAWLLGKRAKSAPALGISWAGLGAAAGAFVGACAPYAASADYTPMVFGIMSRTNGVIAIGGGLLWAVLLDAAAQRWRRTSLSVLAVVLFGMTMADWGNSLQWARSWRIQNDIIKKLSPHIASLPADSEILFADFPVTLEPGGALVFGAHWDTSAAVRFSSGRKDLAADIAPPSNAQFLRDGVTLTFDAASVRRYPYRNLYLFSYDQDALWRLDGPDRRVRM